VYEEVLVIRFFLLGKFYFVERENAPSTCEKVMRHNILIATGDRESTLEKDINVCITLENRYS